MIRRLAVGLLFATTLWPCAAFSQLAITEVMSLGSLEGDYNRPDFWELTNFGEQPVNLDHYGFSDSGGLPEIHHSVFRNLIIAPKESVVFFRAESDQSSVTNVERFRAWWGENNVSTNVQIRAYKSPGLNGTSGDELYVYDANLNIVDHVKYGPAHVGRSWVSEADSGVFGVLSIEGVNGAFRSALGNDIGSPGTNSLWAVEVAILSRPSEVEADAGANAVLSVQAIGLPRPRYEWFDPGGWIIPWAQGPTLIVTNVQPYHQGAYFVRVSNGLSEVVSEAMMLRVNTTPVAPVILYWPADLTIFPRQQAVLSVQARGFPAVHYQWLSNGIVLTGATNRTLIISNLTLNTPVIRYSVEISNEMGSTNAAATLRVMRKPLLRFTEVMANSINSDSTGHFDWFELTNFDTNAVNLQGYRFSDSPALETAYGIGGEIILNPGETMLFVEEMSAESFWDWWTQNTTEYIKVFTYHGFSLNEGGEQLFFWNGAATDYYDVVAQADWANTTRGFTLECTEWYCDEEIGCLSGFRADSVLGQKGAYQAAKGGDIGSPGLLANPQPRIMSIKYNPSQVELSCRVNMNKSYRLWYASTLQSESWTDLGTYFAEGFTLLLTDSSLTEGGPRFYRLEELP